MKLPTTKDQIKGWLIKFLQTKSGKLIPLVFVLTIVISFVFIHPQVLAQQSNWQFDTMVTKVGKNAERARQLIYWIFTHPPSYTVPVLAQIWSLSRNVVYALFILVIALTGLAYVIARREGTIGPIFSGIASPILGITIPRFFFRVGILLIYVTFSYLIIVGMVQSGEIMSRFFIEKFQGCRLFNISFTGAAPLDCKEAFDQTSSLAKIKELEKNYTDFVGYKDTNILNQESVETSLLVVRATTLTYNVLAIILILRQVVLWFLIMVSPFLAILMPFIFIRNTGYIWIGVFFQWLFYGPLVSLFIAGLSQIWIKGIPYAFNFTRINKTDGQIFPTAINILYGGPAQTLSPTNSANYVDTYAEYLIALVMLWVAMVLPWLLLRIFRDYCCDILKQNHGALLSVLDKIRGVGGSPPSPVAPEGSTRIAMQLPFRKTVEESRKINLQEAQNITKANTYELTRSLSLSISSLAEVARHEMDTRESKQVVGTLNRIANPHAIPQEDQRETYSHLRAELETRARQGDIKAQQVLAAAFNKPITAVPIPVSRGTAEISTQEIINTISKETTVSAEKIKEILRELPQITVENQVTVIASRLGLSQENVQQAVSALPKYAPSGVDLKTMLAQNPSLAGEIGKRTGLEENKVREIVDQFSNTVLSENERLEIVAQKTTVSLEKIKELFNKLPEIIINFYPQLFATVAQNPEIVNTVARETFLSKEKVQQVLESAATTLKTISQPGEIEKKTTDLEKVAQKVNVPVSDVATIIKMSAGKIPFAAPKLIAALTKEKSVVAALVKQSNLPETSVKDILDNIAEISPLKSQFEDQVELMSEVSGLSKEKVKDILGTVAAARLEKPKEAKPASLRRPQVTVEDYEEVKNMWTNHYKLSEVPVSDNVQNRSEWLNEDITKLTNILHLLTSLDPRDKEKGMKEVSGILPFLLLGGFSDLETVVYLKAKLQAAKTVQSELEEQEKIKEEVKKEEEGTLVDVPAAKKEAAPKVLEEEQKQTLEFPGEGEETKPVK